MFSSLIKKIYKLLSNEIGIDLGTANTLVYLSGKGIIAGYDGLILEI